MIGGNGIKFPGNLFFQVVYYRFYFRIFTIVPLSLAMAKKTSKRPGLWANIRAKRKRIASGADERMRRPGSKGAPTSAAFKAANASSKKKARSKRKK